MIKRISPWHWPLLLVFGLALSGCGALETIPYAPPQTPETWLQIQPYWELPFGASSLIIIQPSTSIIVYLLGLITIGAGGYFFKIQNGQRSRQWWGRALLLWGLGALLAGSSYEAFSYQLKCAGRGVCIWTSWLEVAYLILSLGSVDAMLAAVAYACTAGRWRSGLLKYALVNFVLYLFLTLVGALLPLPFLISFELLLVAAAPNILLFFIISGRRYFRHKQRMDLIYLGTWAWLVLTIAAYFLYYLSGWTQQLWEKGMWFTENDVLHIGLIFWMLYIVLVMAPHVRDGQMDSNDLFDSKIN